MVRKAEYTTDKHKLFLDALSIGSSLREACDYAGIKWSTWSDWRRRVVVEGDRFNDGIAQLVDEHVQAMERGRAALLAQLRKHSAKDWRAAAYLVDRRDGMTERRLRRDKVRSEIALNVERAKAIRGLDQALAGATDEELATVQTILERAKRRGGGSTQGDRDGAGTTEPVDAPTGEPR